MRGRGKTESVDTWMTSNWSAAVSFGSNLLEQNVKEKHMCMYIYMWQSHVENEGYSVAYFDCITVFEVPYR